MGMNGPKDGKAGTTDQSRAGKDHREPATRLLPAERQPRHRPRCQRRKPVGPGQTEPGRCNEDLGRRRTVRLLPNSKMARGQTGLADRRILAYMIAHGANQYQIAVRQKLCSRVEQLELWAVCSSVCSPQPPRQPQGSHLDPASAGSFLFGQRVRSIVARHRFQGLLISPVALGCKPERNRAVSAHRSGPFGVLSSCSSSAANTMTSAIAKAASIAASCHFLFISSLPDRTRVPTAKSWWFPGGCFPRRHLTAARKLGSTVSIVRRGVMARRSEGQTRLDDAARPACSTTVWDGSDERTLIARPYGHFTSKRSTSGLVVDRGTPDQGPAGSSDAACLELAEALKDRYGLRQV